MLIGVSILVLVIVALLRWGFSERKQEIVLSRQPAKAPAVGIQVVCGNCAGDERRPRRTLMARNGACEACGGHSYLLATALRRPEPIEVVEPVRTERTVIPFRMK